MSKLHDEMDNDMFDRDFRILKRIMIGLIIAIVIVFIVGSFLVYYNFIK